MIIFGIYWFFDVKTYYMSSKMPFLRKLLPTMTAGILDSIIDFPLMSSKTSPLKIMLGTLPERIFDSFMGCPLVVSKTSHASKLCQHFLQGYWILRGLPFDVYQDLPSEKTVGHIASKNIQPFMECLLVFGKIFLIRKLLAALPARILDSFMYCPFLSGNINLCSCLMVAFHSFMYCPFVSREIFL